MTGWTSSTIIAAYNVVGFSPKSGDSKEANMIKQESDSDQI